MELEMRIVKKVAAAAMAMAVVFGAASLKPVAANAAQAGPETASVMEEENSFLNHQDEAYQNEFRRGRHGGRFHPRCSGGSVDEH